MIDISFMDWKFKYYVMLCGIQMFLRLAEKKAVQLSYLLIWFHRETGKQSITKPGSVLNVIYVVKTTLINRLFDLMSLLTLGFEPANVKPWNPFSRLVLLR